MYWKSLGADLTFNVACQLRLPSVSVSQKLLFIVEEFLMVNCGIFVVRALDDCVNRACFLAISTINAFSHIDIVTGSSSRSIRPRLALDCNCLSRAGSSTELTSNTPLLTSGISSQSVLSSKFGRKGPFFIWIMNGPFGFERIEDTAIEKRVEVLWHDNLD